MRNVLRSGLVALALLSLTGPQVPAAPTEKHSAGVGASFKGPVGLQLYSLRELFAKDVPGTLDRVRSFGIVNVELAGTYGLTPERFREQLDARGLKAVAAHYGYDRLRDAVEEVAREAKVLGVEYVGCAWVPHG